MYSNTGTTVKPENKEYPFHEPFIIEPPYDHIIPSIEMGFVPMKEVQSHTPTIYFPKIIYEEIMYLAKYAAKHKGECAFMLLYRKLLEERPIWETIGYYMLPQEATGGDVDIFLTNKQTEKVKEWINENYPNVKTDAQHTGHGHSHGNMGVFWSSTDEKQQKELSQLALPTGCRIFLVVNANKQFKARAVQYGPLPGTEDGKPHIIDNIAVGITYAIDEYCKELTKERKKELEQMVDDLVIKKQVAAPKVTFNNYQNNNNNFSYQANNIMTNTKMSFEDNFSFDEEDLENYITKNINPNEFNKCYKTILKTFINELQSLNLDKFDLHKEYFDAAVTIFQRQNRGSDQEAVDLMTEISEYALYYILTIFEGEEIDGQIIHDYLTEFSIGIESLVELIIVKYYNKNKLNTEYEIMNSASLNIDPETLKDAVGIIFNNTEDSDGTINALLEEATLGENFVLA